MKAASATTLCYCSMAVHGTVATDGQSCPSHTLQSIQLYDVSSAAESHCMCHCDYNPPKRRDTAVKCTQS